MELQRSRRFVRVVLTAEQPTSTSPSYRRFATCAFLSTCGHLATAALCPALLSEVGPRNAAYRAALLFHNFSRSTGVK